MHPDAGDQVIVRRECLLAQEIDGKGMKRHTRLEEEIEDGDELGRWKGGYGGDGRKLARSHDISEKCINQSYKRRQGRSIEKVGSCDRNVELMLLGGIEGRVKHAGTGSLSLPFASWSGIVQSSYCPCRGPHPLPEFSSTALVQL